LLALGAERKLDLSLAQILATLQRWATDPDESFPWRTGFF